MQRFAAVWHASPLKLVGVLFALLLAAAMAVGSGANFTSQTVNAGNVVAAGTLTATGTSGAILNLTKIRPGDTLAPGEVSISNTGNTAGAFTLSMVSLSDTPGTAGGPSLSAKVTLLVQELNAPGGTPVVGSPLYSGLLKDFASAGLGTWNGATTHHYRFTVAFPNASAAVDNLYQGAQATMQFNWDAVQA
jgi:spore coat-associated protein N